MHLGNGVLHLQGSVARVTTEVGVRYEGDDRFLIEEPHGCSCEFRNIEQRLTVRILVHHGVGDIVSTLG